MLDRDTILNMEAGSELDALVAERVMGWELLDREHAGWGKGPPVFGTNDTKRPTIQGWSPSTDIAAAMEVFENDHRHSAWLQRMSRTTGPSDCSRQMNDALCRMDYYRVKIGKYGPWVVARTAPLAICRAALLTTLEAKEPSP